MSDGSARAREREDDFPSQVEFRDANGVHWKVWERDTRMDPGHRAASCLVFESEAAIRRVWTYPPLWHRMSSAELSALGWTR